MRAEGPGLSSLERAILDLCYERRGDIGFPPTDDFKVVGRNYFGAGVVVTFNHTRVVSFDDGALFPGTYAQFDMDGLPAGASYTLCVEVGKIASLDIYVNGDTPWDGELQQFWLLDPDTGERLA